MVYPREYYRVHHQGDYERCELRRELGHHYCLQAKDSVCFVSMTGDRPITRDRQNLLVLGRALNAGSLDQRAEDVVRLARTINRTCAHCLVIASRSRSLSAIEKCAPAWAKVRDTLTTSTLWGFRLGCDSIQFANQAEMPMTPRPVLRETSGKPQNERFARRPCSRQRLPFETTGGVGRT
jgi:hypothetical protein